MTHELSVTCCRQKFGNTPDISKALRMLVTERNVKRIGKGGRAEPFTYQVAHAPKICHAAVVICM